MLIVDLIILVVVNVFGPLCYQRKANCDQLIYIALL